MRMIPSVVPVLATALLLSTACGEGGTTPPAPQVREVRLTAQNTFEPAALTVPRGTRVRFVNDMARLHTIAPENVAQEGSWQEAAVADAGQVFEYIFNKAGTFKFYCRPHVGRGMTGVITVEA